MVIAIIALILVVLVIGMVLKVNSDPIASSRRRREVHYRNVMKPAHQIAASRRASERRSAAINAVKEIWQPRIDKENRKAAASARRAERRMSRGKSNARAAANVARHDRRAVEHSQHMKKELGFTQRLWNSATSGDKKAQNLVGKIHPRTGHTHGGVGREGHKPAHHMPKIREPKSQGKSSPGIPWKKILIGNPKPRRR